MTWISDWFTNDFAPVAHKVKLSVLKLTSSYNLNNYILFIFVSVWIISLQHKDFFICLGENLNLYELKFLKVFGFWSSSPIFLGKCLTQSRKRYLIIFGIRNPRTPLPLKCPNWSKKVPQKFWNKEPPESCASAAPESSRGWKA